MQTFITSSAPPLSACYATAYNLDNKRLGKQRVEAKQILQGAFPNHPATKMWKNKHAALASYGFIISQVWHERGFKDTLMDYFEPLVTFSVSDAFDRNNWPWWFGNQRMVICHRSKLMHKDYEQYKQFTGGLGEWPDTNGLHTMKLPYIWPDPDVEDRFFLSKAELKRESEWELPHSWNVNFNTGEVIFAHDA